MSESTRSDPGGSADALPSSRTLGSRAAVKASAVSATGHALVAWQDYPGAARQDRAPLAGPEKAGGRLNMMAAGDSLEIDDPAKIVLRAEGLSLQPHERSGSFIR